MKHHDKRMQTVHLILVELKILNKQVLFAMGDNLQNIGSWNEILFMNVNQKVNSILIGQFVRKRKIKAKLLKLFPPSRIANIVHVKHKLA